MMAGRHNGAGLIYFPYPPLEDWLAGKAAGDAGETKGADGVTIKLERGGGVCVACGRPDDAGVVGVILGFLGDPCEYRGLHVLCWRCVARGPAAAAASLREWAARCEAMARAIDDTPAKDWPTWGEFVDVFDASPPTGVDEDGIPF